MAIIYHDPNTVTSPKKFIDSITVLYDGGTDGFSLAIVSWEGLDHIGIRWNVAHKERLDQSKVLGEKICAGSPNKNSIPSWFILPRELFNPQFFDLGNKELTDVIHSYVERKQI